MNPTEIEDAKVFYFGVWDREGHYLYNLHRQGVRGTGDVPSMFHPAKMDARYCRQLPTYQYKGDEPEGLAFTHHLEVQDAKQNVEDAPFVGSKWTVIAFWDRSGDSRPGSNSAFLSDGVHTFREMVILARAHFPDVWKRMTESFEIQDIKELR
jgi:hypothetical protein